MVCPALRQTGICGDPECNYTHFLKFCGLCSVTLITEHSYNEHIFGKDHSKRLFHSGAILDSNCTVCAEYLGEDISSRLFVLHCRTLRHQDAAIRLGSDYTSPREVEDTSDDSRICHVCSRVIKITIWSSHIRGRKHLKAVDSRASKSIIDSLGQNQHSVEVGSDEDGEFDFSVVNQGLSEVTLPIDIKLTSLSNVSLVDVRLSSQIGPRKFSLITPFAVHVWTGRLAYNETRTLLLSFKPNQFGRFEDRLELVFNDATLSQRFVIARRVRATVGNQAELQALGPIAPFVRPKRHTRVQDEDEIPGVMYDFASDIKWVVKLPPCRMPKVIENALRSGSPEENLRVVREKIIPPRFDSASYSRTWTSLLYIEELQMITDLSNYDMDSEELTAKGTLYELRVPGLAEKRPSVLLNDKIKVRVHGTSGSWYAGHVHKVEQSTVLLRFSNNFRAFRGQKFDVHFTLGRSPLRRMHQALAVAWNPDRILFPNEQHIEGRQPPTVDLVLFNNKLRDNPAQSLAVASVLAQPPGSVPFVIFGPPGTGKTVVAVECMMQILKGDASSRILACAPSNSAADLLAQRLTQSVGPSEMLRLNAHTRPMGTMPKALDTYVRKADSGFLIPKVEELKRFRVIVTTCISSSLPFALGMPRGHFSHIFIDEAGQALEPEIMISVRGMADNGTNIVLSGDPQQLGPIVRSRIASKCGLATSYLDRLMKRDIYNLERGQGITVVKLVQNFRSHPAILEYPNRVFYDGELRSHADPTVTHSLIRFDGLVTPQLPIIFHAISGEDMRESTSPSFFNPHEVLVVKKYVQALREDQRLQLQDSQIGVITPYNAQSGKIRTAINSSALKKSRPGILKVGSVEEFQGQERRAIIVSTVRSNRNFVDFDMKHTLGFVANPRRFNVAMTRAQALLIVIGDPVVLSLDPLWRDFLDHVYHAGGWCGKPRDWDDDTSGQSLDLMVARRQEAVTEMDDLAQRLAGVVIDGLDGEDSAEEDEDDDDGGQDKPWREDE